MVKQALSWRSFWNQAKNGFPAVDEYATRGVTSGVGALEGAALGAYNGMRQNHPLSLFGIVPKPGAKMGPLISDAGPFYTTTPSWRHFADTWKQIGSGAVLGAKAGFNKHNAMYGDAALEKSLSNTVSDTVGSVASLFGDNAEKYVQEHAPILKKWRERAAEREDRELLNYAHRLYGDDIGNTDVEDILKGRQAMELSEIPLGFGFNILPWRRFDRGVGYVSGFLKKHMPKYTKWVSGVPNQWINWKFLGEPIAKTVFEDTNGRYDHEKSMQENKNIALDEKRRKILAPGPYSPEFRSKTLDEYMDEAYPEEKYRDVVNDVVYPEFGWGSFLSN